MSSTPPIIGICAVKERARWAFWDQTAHLAADTYVERPAGHRRPHRAAAGRPRAPPEALLDRLDGLMLIGGADLDPAIYGQERSEATENTYPDRDEFELALTRAAVDRGLPYLGICRGMQLLNVAFGGTINQNLVSDEGANPHRRIVGTFVGTEHDIDLDPGSLVARAAGEEVHEARCHHHQAIDRAGQRPGGDRAGPRRRGRGDRAVRRRPLGAGRPVAPRGGRQAPAVRGLRGGGRSVGRLGGASVVARRLHQRADHAAALVLLRMP